MERVGRYDLVEKLGEGGMGVVYKAVDSSLRRPVALKVLSPEHWADPDRKQRLIREARAASALSHPNIVTVYEIGCEGGVDFIAMEYVEGRQLSELIRPKGLAAAQAVDFGIEISGALAAAHAAGVIHRDLKPANVMVAAPASGSPGRVKLLDFGLARRARVSETEITGTLTVEGQIAGTPAYMAPEQAEGKTTDHRCDIFAFGAVLYEMLSGRPAFPGESAISVLSAVLRQDPPPLAGVPTELWKLVERCLRKDPERRIQHMDDVKLALADVREELAAAPAPGGAPGREAAAPSRRALRAPPLAVCMLAAAIAAWCAASLLRDPGEVDPSRYRFTPFATALATQTYPSWSPDGRSIAFVSRESGRGQLWVQALNAPTAVALTPPEVNVSLNSSPFWSPDSASAYFLGSSGQETGIYRVAAGGGEPALIQRGAIRATISPDGRTLATLAASDDGKSLHVWTASPPQAPRRLYEPDPVPLAGYANPPVLIFAPDGAKILLAINPDREEMCWLLPWPPGKARRVLTKMPFPTTPAYAWMPDSRHLILSAQTNDTHEQLYMADVASGRYVTVLAQDRPARFPTVSPDGSRLAYESGLSHSDVIAVPLGDGPVQTLLGSSRSEEMAAYSPTAQQVVYVTNRRGGEEVWITSLAEHWDRLLLSPSDLPRHAKPVQFFMTPVFSPDGRRVAVVVAPGAAIYTVFASGGSPVRATTETVSTEYAPTWSPDGKWLAICHTAGSEHRLAKVRPGSGLPPVDLAVTQRYVVPEWSPTGEWIAFHDQDNRLCLVTPDGKSRRTLSGFGPVAWARDGRTIYQARMQSHSLVAIDVNTGKERTLRDLGDLVPFAPLFPGHRASLTPDGKSIVYTVNRSREEIWILDGLQAPRPWYLRLWPQ